MADSLWGEEFIIEDRPKKTKKIIDKINGEEEDIAKNLKSKYLPLAEQLNIIYQNVDRILGRFRSNTVVISDRQKLHDYITHALENKIIAIDTETNNSLDPLTCTLLGPCIYTPGEKNAYIPLNHVDKDTKERLSWQLTEQDIYEEFSRLKNIAIITHNGTFDYQVLKCTTNFQMKITWDTMIAARILNENEDLKIGEKKASLKYLYRTRIDPTVEKYSIDHLFENIEYAVVDPYVFALYAATDPFMTYKLFEWQKDLFEQKGNEDIYKLFLDVEMPIVEVAAEMELTGVCIDLEYSERLSKKYHRKLNIVQEKIQKQLDSYKEIIDQWRQTEEANYHVKNEKLNKYGEVTYKKSKNEQLKDPPELTSPTQFAILLYDVLKVPQVSTKTPRGTGEKILEKINNPLCKLVLEQRGLLKLIDTYIDKLPKCLNEKDNRLHAHFNQLGTDTGRFSSTDPNLQNIPSHDKSIRMMFKAQEGYTLVGSDFSQQEPRLLSQFSQDENMIRAYQENKDLYATIASGVYKNKYEDNLEHYPDGTINEAGDKRRSNCKNILLGLMYGRGVKSIAEQIHGSVEDAQKIINDFYSSFPKVKKWTDDTMSSAKKLGYVEDIWGRRRRLPDIQLPKFEISLKEINKGLNFNPILGSDSIITKIQDKRILKYQSLCERCKSRKEVDQIKANALKEGVIVKDNSGFISQAERQSVNARIQGSAATMSKKAMIKVYRDQKLKDLGFKLMIAVHDELIGECPKENAEEVAERLSDLMKISALPEVQVPFKCDPTIEDSWYYTKYETSVKGEYSELLKQGYTEEAALQYLINERIECLPEQLQKMVS